MSLFAPDFTNLLFALAGAVLGWLYRQRTQQVPPPELQQVLDLLQKLLSQRREQETHELLQRLAAVAKAEQSFSRPH
jgi:hypothetical protein